MKKTTKNFIVIALSLALMLGNIISVHAAENTENLQNVNISEATYEIAPPEEDAILLNTNTYYADNSKITTKTYQLSDGSIVTDTINEGNPNTRSKNGSDVVTRTKTKDGWGTVTLTAYFDWYTKFPFSYVRCSSMTSSFDADDSNPSIGIQGEIIEYYTSDYVSIGKAEASVTYNLYRYYFPSPEYEFISLTIVCTDEGTISDR